MSKISAPSFSRAVASLESALGEKLIHRNAKHFALTTEGQRCYQQFAPRFATLNDQWTDIANLQQELTGLIKISCPEPFANKFLNPIAIEFMRLHPKVKIHIEFAISANHFFTEQLDLAICTTLPDIPQLLQRKLFSMPFVLVASPDYLNSHGRPHSVDELMQHHLLASSSTPNWQFHFEGQTINMPFSPRFLINSPAAIIQAATAGLGICLVPHTIVEHKIARKQLEIVLPSVQAKQGNVYMVWASQQLLAKRVVALKEMILSRLNQDSLLTAISAEL